jgi:hypothetical protein
MKRALDFALDEEAPNTVYMKSKMLRFFENFSMVRENTLTEEGRPSAKLVPVSWVSSSLRANEAWLSTNLTEEGTAVTVSD